jgi:hypothetical protein
MSPRAVRGWAIPLGLLAFALRLTVTFWVWPLAWKTGADNGDLIFLAGFLGPLAIPFGIFAVLTVRSWRRPTRFECRGNRFVAAASPFYGASQAIFWMYLSGNFVFTERVYTNSGLSITDSAIEVAALWAGAVAFVVVQRPQVLLDPHGLTIRRLSSTTIAWDDLAPGGPPAPANRAPRHITVYLTGPDPLHRSRKSQNIPTRRLHIDPTFLAATIRHYVDHPEDRPAIGTPEEMTHLQTAIAAPTTGHPIDA